jgi:hypothetical protein
MSLIINHANSILPYNTISKVQTSQHSYASSNRIGVASDDALSLSPSVTAKFSREAMALQSRTTQGTHSTSDVDSAPQAGIITPDPERLPLNLTVNTTLPPTNQSAEEVVKRLLGMA